MRTVSRARRHPSRATVRKTSSARWEYLALLCACAFALLPIVWAVSTSFKPAAEVVNSSASWIPKHLTFDNYRTVLGQSMVPIYLRNTIIVSLVSVVVTLTIALPAAYAAARLPFRGQKATLFFILVSSMIPGIAVLEPTYYLAVRVGLYDSFMGLILVYAGWQVPTSVWILRGFITSIPVEIEEAGRIDGCSRVGTFFRLVLPMLRPGLGGAFVLAFVYVWNDFLFASTLVSTDSRRMISVGLYNFLTTTGVQWGQLTAAVVVSLVPIIILFASLNRLLVSGLTAGSTKG